MNKKIYYLMLFILFCTGTTFKYANSHEAMPIGCDEFGYLNLAKTIDEGIPENRSYLKELLTTLRGEGIAEHEFSWMITPHAYHIIPGADFAINQYPPGTSYLLSLLPLERRNLLYPLLAMALLILFPVLISKNAVQPTWNFFDIVFPVFLFIVTVSAPFTTELARVNSLAVTFGLLIAAGILLRNRPLLSCFLIALTVNFRIVNILMVLPALLFLPYASISRPAGRMHNFMLLLKSGLLISAAVLPLMIYNYNLIGNPLASTYSVIDTAVNDGGNFLRNLKYYISLDHHWMRVHFTFALLLIFFCITGKLKRADLLKALTFPVINYLFFAWHTVTMDYYPYASAMLLSGIAFGVASEIRFPEKYRIVVPATGMLIAIIILISGLNRYRKKDHITFEQAKEKYSVLCKYDIVWCDLYSGTTEYVCENNGFRFVSGTSRARKITLNFLHQKRLSQVILLNDIPMAVQEIENEIRVPGLEFEKVTDNTFGEMIVIPVNKSVKSINYSQGVSTSGISR